MPRINFPCRWLSCQHVFDDPEDLFTHLSDDHIGRKATNNLCLQCRWNGCGTIAAKRDHLASHLRVHLPLKPHHCTLCSKGFKRPQDLKKHEKIHTVEHQASLLSNQPGYKPVRRRRKQNTNVTLNLADINKDLSSSSEIATTTSDLSSCSPSFSMGKSSVHTQKNPAEFDQTYFHQGYLQDPLQDFIDDVLQNQTLSPNYDTEMMERLDSIAPVIQYNNESSWSLPCEPDAIPALQNWLEQLSASIQTDDNNNIYPSVLSKNKVTESIMTSPRQNTLLSTDDYDLYPKLTDNHVWTSASPSKQSASESSFANTPPLYEQHYSSPVSTSYDKNVNPQFWSPGYISSNYKDLAYSSSSSSSPPPLPPRPSQQQQQQNYYIPSEAIDFDRTNKFEQSVEPNLIFETSKMDIGAGIMTPILDRDSSTFNDKRELVQMINVFSSSSGDIKYTKKTTFEKSDNELRNDDTKDDSDSEDLSDLYKNEDEEEIKSPYADLVGLVKNMKIEDEESIRQRHAALVETLWKRISAYT